MRKRCLIAFAHFACAQAKRKTINFINVDAVRTVLAGKNKSLNVDKVTNEDGIDYAVVYGQMTYFVKSFLKITLKFEWDSDTKAWKKMVATDADYDNVKADLTELTAEWGLDLMDLHA